MDDPFLCPSSVPLHQKQSIVRADRTSHIYPMPFVEDDILFCCAQAMIVICACACAGRFQRADRPVSILPSYLVEDSSSDWNCPHCMHRLAALSNVSSFVSSDCASRVLSDYDKCLRSSLQRVTPHFLCVCGSLYAERGAPHRRAQGCMNDSSASPAQKKVIHTY